ncbi:permease [Staphylococcus cohnii]|uniref:AEC family transporter n=1 Tax=Staphylococcus cohnii TaxID=29382 RepID=UPI0008FB9313|nr:AEC family transporter [Staphylococcus cohnii]TGP62540.1 AEC family transporter [bacterium M00.F.Ca.ET.229.01.1.1]TGS39373.1 AEC family transporter [bacterium M00.F.Ca.ET.180.01.1.1]OIS38309.1 permease [Staphylococcus cohnii]OIS39699.1 permease [Staphylococcus cohnii]OIS40491.1 permease [Staphylococcus cohnii]
MSEMAYILQSVLLPIFIMIALGFILQKKFTLDLKTLAKLNIYVFVPGFIFVKFYKTNFELRLLLYIVVFFIIYIIFLYIVGKVLTLVNKRDKGEATTLTNSVLFFNSGNYGVPVNDLVFKGDPLAMSVQVIVLSLQNIFTFSYGIFAIQSAQIGKLKAMLGYFKMPVLYALLFAIILNYADIPIPEFIWTPANYVADAMIAIALIMLGAQIANINFTFKWSLSYIFIFVRLVIGPVIALIIIKIMGIEGVIAQTLFIASAMPTSVNSSVIAQEYDNHPQLAAELVFLSTLLSSITVVVVIYASKLLF